MKVLVIDMKHEQYRQKMWEEVKTQCESLTRCFEEG
jgi:hypothetical protein